MEEAFTNTNYNPNGFNGGHEVSSFGAGSRAHVLVDISGLSNITAGTVVSAILRLNITAGQASGIFGIVIRKMLAASDVTQTTWNNRLTGVPWSTAGCLADGIDRASTVLGRGVITTSSTGAIEISGALLNQAVQDLINGTSTVYWLEIEHVIDTINNGDSVKFVSQAQIDGQRPVLTVKYLAASTLDKVPAQLKQQAPYIRTALAATAITSLLSPALFAPAVVQDPVPARPAQTAQYVRTVAPNPQQLNTSWLLQQPFIPYADVPAKTNQAAAYNRIPANLTKQVDNSFLIQQLPFIPYADTPPLAFRTAPYVRVRDNNTTQLDTRWLLQLPFIPYTTPPDKPNQSAPYLRVRDNNTTQLDTRWLQQLPFVPYADVPAMPFQSSPYVRVRDNNTTQLDTRWLFQLPFIPNTSDPVVFNQVAPYLRVTAAYPKQLDSSWILQLTVAVQSTAPTSVYQQPYVTQVAQYPQQLNTNWILQLPFIAYADVPPKPSVIAAYLRTSLVNPQPLDSTWLTRIVTLDPVPNLVVQPPSAAKLVTNPQPLNNSWLLQQPFIDYASITPLAFQPAAYNRVQPALPQQLNTSFLAQLTPVVFDPVPATPYQTAPQIPPYYQVRLQNVPQKWLLDYVNPIIPPTVATGAPSYEVGGKKHVIKHQNKLLTFNSKVEALAFLNRTQEAIQAPTSDNKTVVNANVPIQVIKQAVEVQPIAQIDLSAIEALANQYGNLLRYENDLRRMNYAKLIKLYEDMQDEEEIEILIMKAYSYNG